MALLVKDSFELVTPLGRREIQLLVGDITKLPVTQKVDIVIASAYYGDYAPIATTLIGSLKNNLDISVHGLAMDKEVDLRSQFSCWISKPLPSHLPFNRLVCFEYMKRQSSLIEQISNMFRAMMPIFNNKDTTVLTPLLATGDQGHSYLKVINGMVNAACEWIKAGLPLKCLKLVVYSTNPNKPSQVALDCMEWFKNLKKKWLELENMSETESGPYDVCLSWSPENKDLAQKVTHQLLKENSSLKIFSDPFEYNHEDIWQKHIFSVMKNSNRIIVLLTPSYIANSECLEQFSIALCCNKLRQEEAVVPFYLETIPSIPSYMVLVQYIDCRARKEGQTEEILLQHACSNVLHPVQHHTLTASDSRVADSDEEDALRRNRNMTYDVFVSYSHSHADIPRKLVEILQKDHPKLNIFFDISELKAGNLWQQVLYEAAGKAHCVVAFISPAYLTSSVCQEEFNIGLGRYFVQDSVILVPVHYSDDVERVPRSLTFVPIVDARNESLRKLSEKLVHLVQLKQNNESMANISLLKQQLELKRSAEFKEKFKFEGGHVVRTSAVEPNSLKGKVAFSYAPEMVCLAAIMSSIMKKQAPQLAFHLLASSQSQRRMHLDTADLVVVFISDEYLSSPYLVEELHTALCRQRAVRDRTIIYLIQCNHKQCSPIYFHLLPFSISLDDNFWRRLKGAGGNKNPTYEVDIDGMAGIYRCTPDQNLALSAAAHDALFTLSHMNQGTLLTCNIENIYKLQKEGLKNHDELVPLKEHLVALPAFVDLIAKKQGLSEWPSEAQGTEGMKDEEKELGQGELDLEEKEGGQGHFEFKDKEENQGYIKEIEVGQGHQGLSEWPSEVQGTEDMKDEKKEKDQGHIMSKEEEREDIKGQESKPKHQGHHGNEPEVKRVTKVKEETSEKKKSRLCYIL